MNRSPFRAIKYYGASIFAGLMIVSPPALGSDYDNCGWYYDFFCSQCGDIGKPTMGTLGPFPSDESCESDRRDLEKETLTQNIFLNTAACYQYSSCYIPVPLDLYPPKERQRLLHIFGL